MSAAITYAQALLQCRALVFSLARRYARGGADVDDLVQAGMLGLIKAADTWRPDGGAGFASYAHRQIKHALSRTLQRERRRGLTGGAWNGPERTAVERATWSMDAPVTEEGTTLHDVIGTGSAVAVESLVLDVALARLPERDRVIVSLVREGSTLEAAGATAGLSRERTRQIVDDFVEAERARFEGRAPRGRGFKRKAAA